MKGQKRKKIIQKLNESASVTRFGEVSPLWQQKISLLQFLVGLISLWQNFQLTLANVYAIGQIFIVVNRPKMEKMI